MCTLEDGERFDLRLIRYRHFWLGKMASFHAEYFMRHIPSKSALLSCLMCNNVVGNKELSASAYIF